MQAVAEVVADTDVSEVEQLANYQAPHLPPGAAATPPATNDLGMALPPAAATAATGGTVAAAAVDGPAGISKDSVDAQAAAAAAGGGVGAEPVVAAQGIAEVPRQAPAGGAAAAAAPPGLVAVHRDSSMPGFTPAGGADATEQDDEAKRREVLKKLEGQSTQLEEGLKVSKRSKFLLVLCLSWSRHARD